MKPVMEVREITSRVIGMLNVIQSSIVTYFKGEDEEMVAVRGPIQIMVQVNEPEVEDNFIESNEISDNQEVRASQLSDSVIKGNSLS